MPTRTTIKKPTTKPRKKAAVKPAVEKEPEAPKIPQTVVVKRAPTSHKSVGRRKESVARAMYLVSPTFTVTVNGKPLEKYFNHNFEQHSVLLPFRITNWTKGTWMLKVVGGGKRGQAEGIRLAISRLLILLDPTLRPVLKKQGFLTRDARIKERKKYGLKRARRAPQWQKR